MVFRLLVALWIAHVLTPTPALAYIDPLAGSIFLQALIAGILGAMLGIKRVGFAVRSILHQVWRRLTG